MVDDERIAAGPHPAGRRGYRPGVRLVELRPAVLERVPLTAVLRELVPAVSVLECVSCGALLAPGSPLAAAHVATHRGPRWRRAVRDARIRIRRLTRR